MKKNCKLASGVLVTRVPYQSRASKTHFPLAKFVELDMIMPHRSRVLNSRVKKNINLEFFTLNFKQRKKKCTNPEKEERTGRKKEPRKKKKEQKKKTKIWEEEKNPQKIWRWREEPTEDLKKEQRDVG